MKTRIGRPPHFAGLSWGLALVLLLGGACSRSKPDSQTTSADAGTSPASARKPEPAAQAKASAPELCEHGVPAELCTRCTPELIEVFKAQDDWCEEHGLPESQCRQCNPGLTFTASQAPADWCGEHGVPESMCTKCNPKLVAKFVAAGDFCREHGVPLSVCPVHNPGKGGPTAARVVFPPADMKVRLSSEQTSKDAGLRTETTEKKLFGRTLEVVGQLDFNQNRLAQLVTRGEAMVLGVEVDVGDSVKEGQPLAALVSGAVGETQGQLSAARALVEAMEADVQRQQGLVEKGISARQELEAARARLASARGEEAAARASLGATGASTSSSRGRYAMTSPFAGTVVARDAVVGRVASPGQMLLQVADLSMMWAQLEIPEAEATEVRTGQKVTLTFEGVRTEARDATVTRVGATVDAATRTVRVRVELPNPDGTLKAGTFVRARIQVAAERETMLIPRDAVQRAEGKDLVFIRQEANVFRPVAVVLGSTSGARVEVLEGLSPGQDVVTTGAFLLKTEILKDSIGAGCCEEGTE